MATKSVKLAEEVAVDDDEDYNEAEEYDKDQIDAYGNKKKAPQEEDPEMSEGSFDKTDAHKIKENLRNSSKIYYKMTHSVQEEINQ